MLQKVAKESPLVQVLLLGGSEKRLSKSESRGEMLNKKQSFPSSVRCVYCHRHSQKYLETAFSFRTDEEVWYKQRGWGERFIEDWRYPVMTVIAVFLPLRFIPTNDWIWNGLQNKGDKKRNENLNWVRNEKLGQEVQKIHDFETEWRSQVSRCISYQVYLPPFKCNKSYIFFFLFSVVSF